MINRFIISISILIGGADSVFSQERLLSALPKIDSINIARAAKLTSHVLGNNKAKTNYIIFSIGENLLLIEKSNSKYKSFLFKEIFNFDTQKKELIKVSFKKIKKNKHLDNAFKSSICSIPFLYSDSLGLEKAHWDSEYVYFSLVENNMKVCEFNLPVMYAGDNHNENIIPLDKEILAYLLSNLLNN